jgi:hypothetical protein
MFGARSGCAASTPVSTTATTVPPPTPASHASATSESASGVPATPRIDWPVFSIAQSCVK